jgi:hypothetical protein
MRWSVALPLFAALAAGAVGCRSCDRVESELRAREEDVRTLKDEVGRLDAVNNILERELAAVRGEPGPDGIVHPPSEPYPVRSLVVGRQTGPSEDCGGLIVVVEPRDCDNQAIKAPGFLVVEVVERPEEGVARPLGRWEIPPDELRRTWQSGLFSAGYRLHLKYQVWPRSERLRVTARFRMINGRLFEADRDIVLRLPPEKRRRTPPLPEPREVHPPAPKAPSEPAPELLPPPMPVPDSKPGAPRPENESPGEKAGPVLTRVKSRKPIVEMFRPVPLSPE